MKFAFTFLAASMLLTACKHAELAHPQPTDTETHHHFGGKPTEVEVATDTEIRRNIVGKWTMAEDPRWATFHFLTIRPDDGFATFDTSGTKVVCQGTWFVERGFLLLVKSNAAPFDYYGFHKIDRLDEHHLVCGVGMSVGGRFVFTK